MKVLAVCPQYPWPLTTGGFQRVYYLTAELCRRHDVTLIAMAGPDDVTDPLPLFSECTRTIVEREAFHPSLGLWDSPLDQIRSLVGSSFPRAVTRSDWPVLRRVLAQLDLDRFDLVYAFGNVIAEVVRQAGARLIVVDLSDVHSDVLARELTVRARYGRKPLHRLEQLKTRRYERRLPDRFEALTVCKAEDTHFFADRENVWVVPNGMNPQPPVDRALERECEMLFVGSLDYAPNVDACLYFASELLPAIRARVPGARVVFAGRNPLPQVSALGSVEGCRVAASPADMRPLYERAALVVVPLRLGSGTKLKVLEALSLGKAVVSTMVGAEGLELQDRVHLSIANSSPAFVSAAVSLLNAPAERARLGDAGRATVTARFSWDAIGQRLERHLTGARRVAA